MINQTSFEDLSEVFARQIVYQVQKNLSVECHLGNQKQILFSDENLQAISQHAFNCLKSIFRGFHSRLLEIQGAGHQEAFCLQVAGIRALNHKDHDINHYQYTGLSKLYHDSARLNGPIWQGIFNGKPRSSIILDLPKANFPSLKKISKVINTILPTFPSLAHRAKL